MATKKPAGEGAISRSDRESAFISKAHAEFGKYAVQSGHEIKPRRLLSSGAWQLDNSLGGGWSMGTIKLLWGWEHCGKTTIALKAASEVHKTCSSCQTYINPIPLLNPHRYTGDWDTGYWQTDGDEVLARRWDGYRLSCVSCGSPYHVHDRPPSLVSEVFEEGEAPPGISADDYICDDCGAVGQVVPIHPDDEYVRYTSTNHASCECGKNTPTVVWWIDLEGKGDLKWASDLGVDLSRLRYVRAQYAEAAFDLVKGSILNGLADLVIIDSLAGASPAVEIEKSMGEATMGLAARLVNRVVRELPAIMTDCYQKHGVEPTVFLLNQVRNKIGGFGGHTLYAGEGQRFASDQIVKLTSSTEEVEEVMTGAKSRKESLGLASMVSFRFGIEKNGVAPTRGIKGECQLASVTSGDLMKGDFDDVDLLVGDAIKLGFVTKDGGWRVEGWPRSFRIKDELIQEIKGLPALKRMLQSLIVNELLTHFDQVQERLGKGGKDA